MVHHDRNLSKDITMEFQPWKDYFQLSSLVKEMARINTGKPQPPKPFQINRAALEQRQDKGEEANYGAATCLMPFEEEPPVISTPPDSSYEDGLTSAPNLNPNKHRTYQYPPKTLDNNFNIEPGVLAKTSQVPPASSSPTKRKGQLKNAICHFCKHNGEAPHVYSDHNLKDERGKVICPVLRMYTCSLCGATGESSHTRKYCPLNKNKDIRQRKTERNSAGHRMKH